tara:strand:+ start:366077 stop:366625 length:549 start_codon:yes stop_codon:yes gene_type:complete
MKLQPKSSKRAFTLIETVISLSIMTVLILGLSGALMISTSAIPTGTQLGIEDQKVIDGLNQLRDELQQAVHVHFNWTDTDIHLHLTMDQTRAKGTPEIIEYHYRTAAKTFTRMYKEGNVLGTEYILFDAVTDGSGKVILDSNDGDATVVWLMLNVEDTIQKIFEVHIALPAEPTVEIKAGSK